MTNRSPPFFLTFLTRLTRIGSHPPFTHSSAQHHPPVVLLFLPLSRAAALHDSHAARFARIVQRRSLSVATEQTHAYTHTHAHARAPHHRLVDGSSQVQSSVSASSPERFPPSFFAPVRCTSGAVSLREGWTVHRPVRFCRPLPPQSPCRPAASVTLPARSPVPHYNHLAVCDDDQLAKRVNKLYLRLSLC